MGRAREKTPTEPPPINLTVTHTIDLAPEDWAWATWRPRRPVPPPPPTAPAPPFKLKLALNRVARLRVEEDGEWNWGLTFKPPVAREAAHFWLTALTAPTAGTTPQELAQQLEKGTYDGHVTVATVIERLAGGPWDFSHTKRIWEMLDVLLTPGEIMEVLLDERAATVLNWDAHDWVRKAGGRLTQQEVDRLKPLARAKFDLARWPAAADEQPPMIFHIAARLGLHEEVLALVRSWPDDRYRGMDAWRSRRQDPQLILFGLGEPSLVDTHIRRLKLLFYQPEHVRGWLAHTELSGLDYLKGCILFSDGGVCDKLMEEFCRVKAPEAAPHLLELRLAGKSPGRVREWLEQEVGNGVAGLLPVAAGHGKPAEAALEYLREVKRKGHVALIEEQVRQAAPEVAHKIRHAILEHTEKVYPTLSHENPPDWLRTALETTVIPDKDAKLPAWITPTRLTPVLVGDDRLSDAQALRLVQALKASQLGLPLPLLAAVKEHADRASLEAFGLHLFEIWEEEHAPPIHKWVVTVLGHLGGDATALKLTPLIRLWGAGSRRQQGIHGAECLCAIGTDTALMELNSLAEKSKPPSLQRKARGLIDELAKTAGLSKDQLDDRLVPDLGLDERGTRIFDFGPRKFRVVLDTDLKPLVRDEAGKVKADLPKPGAKDDAEKANAAVAEWKKMKKQLREAAKHHAARLERAMIDGRRWAVREFDSLLVRRPLMFNLVRRLLWAGYDDKGTLKTAFRVTEEREYTDIKDTPITLEGVASVSVLHPYQLSESDRATWGELLADYDIHPPFPQLGRPVYHLEPAEREAKQFTRILGRKLAAVWFLGILEKAGWERPREYNRDSSEYTRHYPAADVTVVVEHSPGISPGNPRDVPEQTLDSAYVVQGRSYSGWRHDESRALPLGQVDPIVISETLKDLTALASKGTQGE